MNDILRGLNNNNFLNVNGSLFDRLDLGTISLGTLIFPQSHLHIIVL